MAQNVVKITETSEPSADPIVCPSDLTGQWAVAFQDLADIVSTQSGLWPADSEQIASVVRSQRRCAVHEQLALAALQQDPPNTDEFGVQSKLANAASAAARSGLTQLKAHPQIRNGRAAKTEQGKMIGSQSGTWRDLL